jgi:hypothetical protein
MVLPVPLWTAAFLESARIATCVTLVGHTDEVVTPDGRGATTHLAPYRVLDPAIRLLSSPANTTRLE